MTSQRPRSPRALTVAAEVLEFRHLLSGDVSLAGLDGFAVAGATFSGAVASYEIPPTVTAMPSYATIDWGDGITSVGEIRPPLVVGFARGDDAPPVFGPRGVVFGTHTYRSGGDFTVKTTMVMRATGQADRTVETSSTLHVAAREVSPETLPTLTTASGFAVDNLYARFLTNVRVEPSSWKATIDWGDGSDPVAARVTPATWISRGSLIARPDDAASMRLEVVAAHAYRPPGTYTATITIDDGHGLTATATRTVEALATPLVVHPREVTVVADPSGLGTDSRVALADVADLSLREPDSADLSRYQATIDWGDGSPASVGSLSRFALPGMDVGVRSTFAIFGSHAYANAGTYRATITVTDEQNHTASATATIHAVDEVLALEPAPLVLVRNLFAGGVLASGTSSAIGNPSGADGLKATIDWGDGSPVEAGAVVAAFDGTFSILGRHAYSQPGTYTAVVTVTGIHGATATVDATVTVAGFVGIPNSAQIHVGESYGLDDRGVGLVGIPGLMMSPADFTATIDWGDGSPAEAGTLVAKDASRDPWSAFWPDRSTMMVVKGNHAYSRAGVYSLQITVTSASGETHTFGNLISVVPEAVAIPIGVISPPAPRPQVPPSDAAADSTLDPESDATPQVAIPRRRGRRQGKGPQGRRWPEVTRFGHPGKPLKGKARIRAMIRIAALRARQV